MLARWDIFCKVVDNFGDAGVCWRLARALVREHGKAVRLWIDAPRALERMAPAAEGVDVRTWAGAFEDAQPAAVIVEAFGCGLPDAYAAAMARATPRPAWFILEYLSAEAWVDRAHGLPSPHPQLPLARRFWFPGFTARTGGLLRERGLFEARDTFRASDATGAFWSSLALPAPVADESRVSLFCYPQPALGALFDAWADAERPVVCVVPEGTAVGALDAWTGGAVPHPGRPCTRGRLALHAVPFLAQDDYDRLLWCCDVNFVRGEDSFVRAQWAARPFAWHAYPQDEGAHLGKLDAFLDRFCAGLAPSVAAPVRRFHHAWNGGAATDALGSAWVEFDAVRPQLREYANGWADSLALLPELAAGLVRAASDEV
jgi:uncharacterized repeat protein (TIGR03837 family)